jgi:outer membrane protein assembly factor BamA
MSDGDTFNESAIRQSLARLRELYASRGFIDFVAEPEFNVDDNAQEIGLLLVLQEGKQFVYREVQVLGLDPAMESLLRERLAPGDVVNPDLVDDFFEQNRGLLPLGASRRNSVRYSLDGKSGTEDITVDVRPCP